MSGDVAILGAWGDDDQGANSGSAYIFRWNGATWIEEQKLLSSDGAPTDSFGRSVCISGDVAIVGAPTNDDLGAFAGSAYVFRWNGSEWIEEQKLLACDGAPNDYFGWAVAISNEVAVVGAFQANDMGADSGSAYVFRWNGATWIEEQELHAPEFAGNDRIGNAVAIAGDTVVVGASQDDDLGDNSGAAYVFRWTGSTWAEEKKLLASDGTDLEYFGWSVAVADDTAVVGAYNDDDQGMNSGSAYVFRWNGIAWIEEQKLLASDGVTHDTFGNSVAIAGDTAVIGAPGNDDAGSESGSAYVFRWNGATWAEERKLLASDSHFGDRFGWSVGVSGDIALVGADAGDNPPATDAGSAFLFFIGQGEEFSRGDANGDGHFNLADQIATLAHLFDAHELDCRAAADINDDESVDIADVIYSLLVLFTGGISIPPPLDCDLDPTLSSLQCAEFFACP